MEESTVDKLNIERPPETPPEASDSQRRLIYLSAEPLTLDIATSFMAALAKMAETPGMIRVILCSTGGSEPAGWAIYDAIRACPEIVIVDATGAVWSMAVTILQAADVKRMTKECRLMIHAGTVSMSTAIDQRTLMAYGAEAKKTNRRYQKVIAERTGIPFKKITQWCDAETYFSAARALQEGFIDAIVPYADAKVIRKKRKRK
jgi:ATP-dependent Clp protease protease subunit